MMKTTTLATVLVLICSLVLAPSLLRAGQDDWYQGRKGQWVQQQNAWQFRDGDGNVYRQHGKSWGWYNGRIMARRARRTTTARPATIKPITSTRTPTRADVLLERACLT